jgi:hypothetical protein
MSIHNIQDHLRFRQIPASAPRLIEIPRPLRLVENDYVLVWNLLVFMKSIGETMNVLNESLHCQLSLTPRGSRSFGYVPNRGLSYDLHKWPITRQE